MRPIKSRETTPPREIAQITEEEKIDLYSFSVSLVLHMVILLIMAILSMPTVEPPARIELSFSSAGETEYHEDSVVEIDIELAAENIEDISAQEYLASDIEEKHEFELIEPYNMDQTDTAFIPDANVISTHLVNNEEAQDPVVSDNEDPRSVIRKLANSVGEGLRAGNRPRGQEQNGDIGSRLAAAGAKTGDVQISIAWNSIDDIDLHVEFSPGNGLTDRINWMSRFGRLTGGMLDVDMNANNFLLNPRPVENVFWPPNSSPSGYFDVYIHFYRSWTGNTRVPVTIVVKSMGEVSTYKGVAVLGMGAQHITRFSTLKMQRKF